MDEKTQRIEKAKAVVLEQRERLEMIIALLGGDECVNCGQNHAEQAEPAFAELDAKLEALENGELPYEFQKDLVIQVAWKLDTGLRVVSLSGSDFDRVRRELDVLFSEWGEPTELIEFELDPLDEDAQPDSGPFFAAEISIDLSDLVG